MDVAVCNSVNIGKEEKPEKSQGLREWLRRKWGAKATLVPVVIGPVTPPKMEEWLQQIPGATSQLSGQKS